MEMTKAKNIRGILRKKEEICLGTHARIIHPNARGLLFRDKKSVE